MKMIIVALSIVLAATSVSASDVYKVEVTKVSDDLYETSNGVIIQTQYCWEWAINDDAILKIDSDFGYTIGEIIFDNGRCDVKKLLR